MEGKGSRGRRETCQKGGGEREDCKKIALRELIKRGYGSLERLWFSGMKAFRSVNDAGNSPKRA